MRRWAYPRTLVLLLVMLMLSAASGAAHHSHANPNADSEHILSSAEFLRHQAELYAAEFGVTVEEAEHRLTLQPYISELAVALAENEGDTFAQVSVDNETDYLVTVQVTVDGASRVDQYISEHIAEIVRVEVVTWSLSQLLEYQAEANQIGQELGIAMSTGVADQQVRIYVTDTLAFERQLNARGLQLPPPAVLIEMPGLAEPTSHQGTALTGGVPLTTCTSGFAGRRNANNEKGIYTAGHCSTSQSFAGHQLTPVYQYQLSGPDGDVQFHANSSGEPLRNLVRISPSTLVPITGLYWHSWLYVNQWVCKMGLTTNYTCGQISEIYHDPGGHNPYEGYNRNAVFVLVRGSSNLADPGDSGGPWIGSSGAQHNAAFGIQSGKYPYNGYYWAFFTPINHITNHGYSIFVNCANYYC